MLRDGGDEFLGREDHEVALGLGVHPISFLGSDVPRADSGTSISLPSLSTKAIAVDDG